MGRRTNLALLAVLPIAFLTGWLAFAYGTAPSRWSLAIHASTGFVILALLPWKSMVARRGLARPRPGRWASVALVVLVIASLLGGLLHSTGLLRWWGPYTAMELHVGAAIAAVPLVLWHVLARRIRPRPFDLSRRNLLRGGALVTAATAGYVASEGVVRLAGLPGSGRRFTGSYEVGSFVPEAMPVSSWLLDSVPQVDSDHWALRMVAPDGGIRRWTYDELTQFEDRTTAILDCTGGFWSAQHWTGVTLDKLVQSPGPARSIKVVSVTGYDRRFAIEELPRLLLALKLGEDQLSPDHGFPARLVAPDRRGFWWVKWVSEIHLEAAPYWWQLPFPLQ